jgi:hypothetical protein
MNSLVLISTLNALKKKEIDKPSAILLLWNEGCTFDQIRNLFEAKGISITDDEINKEKPT